VHAKVCKIDFRSTGNIKSSNKPETFSMKVILRVHAAAADQEEQHQEESVKLVVEEAMRQRRKRHGIVVSRR
jgi:hypothetical protein